MIFLYIFLTILIAVIILIKIFTLVVLMKPSNWKRAKMYSAGDMFALKPLHAYIYGRWTGTYIKFLINQVQPRLGPKGKKWLSDRYHAKIITTEQASSIININKDIPLK
ncbi:MAG: hypothetical protein KAS39_00890, partial [Actinomycetia bacterium]|nr:hypothetical protein [Actinomycetes bacterium]